MADFKEHTKSEEVSTSDLVKIFLRSLSIQSSWNFSSMQNIGFAFSLIPFVKKSGKNREHRSRILKRHLELFSTHPCLSGPIIGSVVKLEEESCENSDCVEVVNLKKALMAPYAAIGDPFFWGALKPLSAVVGVIMAIKGFLVAPLIFLLLYNSFHIWVRLRGFIEGYRDGKGAINFIRVLNLPEMSRKIRWISVILLGILAGAIIAIPPVPYACEAGGFARILLLIIILLCFWMVKKGISPLVILYGTSIIFLIVAV